MALARAFPETRIVIEPAGMLEDTSPEGWELWRCGMGALAAAPNVAVKLSALGTFVRGLSPDLMAAILRERSAFSGWNAVSSARNSRSKSCGRTMPASWLPSGRP